jgi:hypothetical protein
MQDIYLVYYYPHSRQNPNKALSVAEQAAGGNWRYCESLPERL